MSGILEIAPAGVPDAVSSVKDRSIATVASEPRAAAGGRARSFESAMFASASVFFRDLLNTRRRDTRRGGEHHAAQDRAIAEQESDIASDAPDTRIFPVPGAARAAVRERAVMSDTAAQNAIAATPRGDVGARAAWWRPLPLLLSRLRRALHAPAVSDGSFEALGAQPVQWAFARGPREFTVSRRRQSGGIGRIRRVPRS